MFYPPHVDRCINPKFSESGKSSFLTKLIKNFFIDNGKIHTYSPALHQDLCQKGTKCSNNSVQTNIIQNSLNERGLDLLIEEIFNPENFAKSETEIETYESKEELRYPREYDSKFPNAGDIDILNEKQINDLRVYAFFKRPR